jgi:hypothetical protein
MKICVRMEVACRICRISRRLGKVLRCVGCEANHCSGATLPIFHPEFGRFMLEATPGKPWGIGFKDLLDVESNMKLR